MKSLHTLTFSVAMCLLAIVFCCVGCRKKKHVDLLVHHALIYTVDSNFTQAEAMAISEGKIVAVGSNDALLTTYTADTSIEANGRIIYPGFIDAHAHFVGYGQSLFMVNLYGAPSWENVLQQVQSFAQAHPDEQWISGRGWDQNLWPEKAFPTNDELNRLFPDKPVVLRRVDGHAALVNDAALRLANIQPGQAVAGGKIVTINGRLTGLLIDNAVNLINAVMPKNTASDYAKWLTLAEKNCFATGLTTVADCGLMYYDIDNIDRLQKDGKLNMRLYAMLSDDTANYRLYLHRRPYKTERLFVKGIKLYADGALGSRGACLLQPYSDQPQWSGFLLSSSAHFDSVANMIAATDYQLCTHAIGDSANRIILQLYNRVLKGKNDRRWRIEHAQVVNAQDRRLFASASVIPSVQPTHATSDMSWVKERLGNQRIADAYAYRSLLNQNGWMPLGTDFPIEDISPLKTFYAAVFRNKTGADAAVEGFQMNEALSRKEALQGLTIWAAKACFLEKEIGSLEPGKSADFIMLNADIMKAAPANISGAKVLATYLAGKRVF